MLPREVASYRGLWWLPSEPANRLAGTLTVDPAKGILLEITGSFSKSSLLLSLSTESFPVIHGFANDNKVITLFRIPSGPTSWSANGVTLTQYIPRLVVLGAHYTAYKDIRITEFTAELDLLDEWIGISGFQTKVDLKERPEISMEYRRPDNVVLFTSPDVEWQVRWKVTLPATRIPQKEVSVGERPHFYAAAKSSISFEVFQHEAQQFRKLTALWLGAPVQMTALSAVDTESGDRRALEFMWASGLDERKPSQVRLHEIVRFSDLQADLQRVIAFYRENETKVAPIIDLWDLLPFQEEIHHEQRFLNYCQIAEAFHRRTIGGTDQSPEKYAEFLKTILNAVPQEHREWLEGKLSYANEFSFPKRIRDLCKRSNVNSHAACVARASSSWRKFCFRCGAFGRMVPITR